MGNYNKKPLKDYQLNSANYTVINKFKQYSLIRHNQSGLFIQEYIKTLNDQQQLNHQTQVFLFRLNHNHIVRSFYFNNQSVSQFCSNFYKIKIYLQRISLRLSDIKDIPYPDVLHLIQSSILGFTTLYKIFGYFQVMESMIGINNQCQVKIWLNNNFSELQPKKYSFNPKTEEDMVLEILNLIEENTDSNNIPVTFKMYWKQRQPTGFDQTDKRLKQYSKMIKYQIPEYMECAKQVIKSRIQKQIEQISEFNIFKSQKQDSKADKKQKELKQVKLVNDKKNSKKHEKKPQGPKGYKTINNQSSIQNIYSLPNQNQKVKKYQPNKVSSKQEIYTNNPNKQQINNKNEINYKKFIQTELNKKIFKPLITSKNNQIVHQISPNNIKWKEQSSSQNSLSDKKIQFSAQIKNKVPIQFTHSRTISSVGQPLIKFNYASSSGNILNYQKSNNQRPQNKPREVIKNPIKVAYQIPKAIKIQSPINKIAQIQQVHKVQKKIQSVKSLQLKISNNSNQFKSPKTFATNSRTPQMNSPKLVQHFFPSPKNTQIKNFGNFSTNNNISKYSRKAEQQLKKNNETSNTNNQLIKKISQSQIKLLKEKKPEAPLQIRQTLSMDPTLQKEFLLNPRDSLQQELDDEIRKDLQEMQQNEKNNKNNEFFNQMEMSKSINLKDINRKIHFGQKKN